MLSMVLTTQISTPVYGFRSGVLSLTLYIVIQVIKRSAK